MDKYSIRDTTLTDIADAIRSKTKETGEIKVNEMAGKIGGISGSSEDLTAVLNEQDAIITRLETALEGKASGGGSAVETCVIQLELYDSLNLGGNHDVANNPTILYIDSNGEYVHEVYEINATVNKTINVTKNSVICINSFCTVGYWNYREITGGLVELSKSNPYWAFYRVEGDGYITMG